MNHIIVLSDEHLKRVFAGLGELPAKFSHEVIVAIEDLQRLAEKDARTFVSLVKSQLKPHEASIPAEPAP